MISLPSPKSRFLLDTKRADAWSDLASSEAFVQALDYALLQFVHESAPGQVYDAQAAAHRLEGAKRVLEIVQRLGVAHTPAERKEEATLDYTGKASAKAATTVPAHLIPHSRLTPENKNPS
jgi:hypothetical protein